MHLKIHYLLLAKLHGQLTKESLSIQHTVEVITRLQDLVASLTAALETRLNKAEKDKADKFK